MSNALATAARRRPGGGFDLSTSPCTTAG